MEGTDHHCSRSDGVPDLREPEQFTREEAGAVLHTAFVVRKRKNVPCKRKSQSCFSRED